MHVVVGFMMHPMIWIFLLVYIQLSNLGIVRFLLYQISLRVIERDIFIGGIAYEKVNTFVVQFKKRRVPYKFTTEGPQFRLTVFRSKFSRGRCPIDFFTLVHSLIRFHRVKVSVKQDFTKQ